MCSCLLYLALCLHYTFLLWQWISSHSKPSDTRQPKAKGLDFGSIVSHQNTNHSLNKLIPRNSNTFSDWRRTCHVLRAMGHNSLNSFGRTKLTISSWKKNLNFRVARDQVVPLETAANLLCQPASSKSIFFISFHLWSLGNKTHCFIWGQSLSAYYSTSVHRI